MPFQKILINQQEEKKRENQMKNVIRFIFYSEERRQNSIKPTRIYLKLKVFKSHTQKT